jgi:hypothetical protein
LFEFGFEVLEVFDELRVGELFLGQEGLVVGGELLQLQLVVVQEGEDCGVR